MYNKEAPADNLDNSFDYNCIEDTPGETSMLLEMMDIDEEEIDTWINNKGNEGNSAEDRNNSEIIPDLLINDTNEVELATEDRTMDEVITDLDTIATTEVEVSTETVKKYTLPENIVTKAGQAKLAVEKGKIKRHVGTDNVVSYLLEGHKGNIHVVSNKNTNRKVI